MLPSTTIAGLKVTNATKAAVLQEIAARLEQGNQTRIITPYSEFLFAALRDPRIMSMLNGADIAIADGVGMLWAATYLHQPLSSTNRAARIIAALWQMVNTGAQILLRPQSIYNIIPEKIVGADFFWDLASLAASTQKKVYLLGGFGDVAGRTAEKLKSAYPEIIIAGTNNKRITDQSIIGDINQAAPDFLFVAFNPIAQDQWIAEHLPKLPSVKLAIGLGGTFDYVTGNKIQPPKFIRAIGLEWLFRLITQPGRYKRIYNATIGLIALLVKYKILNNKYQEPNIKYP